MLYVPSLSRYIHTLRTVGMYEYVHTPCSVHTYVCMEYEARSWCTVPYRTVRTYWHDVKQVDRSHIRRYRYVILSCTHT